jgi:hypothetical protein
MISSIYCNTRSEYWDICEKQANIFMWTKIFSLWSSEVYPGKGFSCGQAQILVWKLCRRGESSEPVAFLQASMYQCMRVVKKNIFFIACASKDYITLLDGLQLFDNALIDRNFPVINKFHHWNSVKAFI